MNTINEIQNSDISVEKILSDMDCYEMDDSLRNKYIEFLITTSDIENYLIENQNYSLFVSDNERTPFRCFSKRSESGLRTNIFFHHKAQFLDNVTTYNYADKKYEYFKDTEIYVRSEFYKDSIYCIFFLHNDVLPTKLETCFSFIKKCNK